MARETEADLLKDVARSLEELASLDRCLMYRDDRAQAYGVVNYTSEKKAIVREIAADLLRQANIRAHRGCLSDLRKAHKNSKRLSVRRLENYVNNLIMETEKNLRKVYTEEYDPHDFKVDWLDLNPKVRQSLEENGVIYLGQLAQKTVRELAKYPGIYLYGTNLRKIKKTLALVDLHLGMDLDYVPPEESKHVLDLVEVPWYLLSWD